MITRCHRARCLISPPTRAGPSVVATVGHAQDLVRTLFAKEPLVHAERHLDVFAREGPREAAHLLEHVAAPDVEGAGGAEHEAEAAPRNPDREECAEIVEVLEGAERVPVERAPAGS